MHAPPPPKAPPGDTPADLRWQRAVDASLAGDPLTPDDRHHLDHHPGDAPATRRERELLHDLRHLGLTTDLADLGPEDEALLAAAVDRFLAAGAPTAAPSAAAPLAPAEPPAARSTAAPSRIERAPRPIADTAPSTIAAIHATPRPIADTTSAPRPATAAPADLPAAIDLAARRSRHRTALTLGLSAAAAAALWLIIIGPIGHVFKDMSDEINHPDAGPLAAAPAPAQRPALRLLEGRAAAGPHLPAGAALPVGPLALADRACIGAAPHLRACAEGQVLLTIVGDDALALERGRLRVDLAASVHLYRFEVAGVSITSDAPAAFVLIADTDLWELHVERGELRLAGPDGDARTLHAGQRELHPDRAATASSGPADDTGDTSGTSDDAATTRDTSDLATAPQEHRPASRPRAPSDPAALLTEANALRGAGDPRAAAAVYRRLIREHQGTSLARTAQVTLGQLYLGPLADPRAALTAFDAYLSAVPQGALAEEALHGRIDALRRLGRDRQAAEAAAEFLRRFPRSRHADELRALLDGP